MQEIKGSLSQLMDEKLDSKFTFASVAKRVFVQNWWYAGADPETSERGGRVPPPPTLSPSPNENVTFRDMQHTAF